MNKKQSIRQRPGKKYEPGDRVKNRVVGKVKRNSKELDRISYIITFIPCGHKATAAHKSLTRAEIRGADGLCRECQRIEKENNTKPKKERSPTWPPHPDRELHLLAHKYWRLPCIGAAPNEQ